MNEQHVNRDVDPDAGSAFDIELLDGDDEQRPDADVDTDRATQGVRERLIASVTGIHTAAWLTGIGALVFAVVFGRLGMQHHRNFGTWAYDMGIYDQGFWLVSHGKSWMTVRGLDFWGHHTNLIVIAFVPFYWLGAGPSFLYVAQAATLAAGAIPTYLLARDRMRNPWIGLAFAVVYLMYAPIQWISWANFHPEALVVTPLLFAWWFGTQRRWRPFFVALVLAMSTREDVALAVFMMGIVLWFMLRHDDEADRRDRRLALATAALGVVWYAVCTRLLIPAFNQGRQPFYVEAFYGNYGTNTFEVVQTMVSRPDRVVSDATQPDRLRFYRDLFLPWGGLPLAGLGQLMMALPQMLASVIGLSPYHANDPLPIHGRHDRADRHRVDRGDRIVVAIQVRAAVPRSVVARLRLRDQHRVVAITDRRQLGRLGAADRAARGDADGSRDGPRQSVGRRDLCARSAPVASRADL